MRFSCRLFCAALLVLHATPLLAQGARVSGTVVDTEGKAIRGATVTMEHPDTGQSVTTASDARGRFFMLGLRPGQWEFTIAAPGYMPVAGKGVLRVGTTANPLHAIMRVRGPLLGSLGGVQVRDLQADLTSADTLLGQQRWDEAIALYRSILEKAPVLTYAHLQIGAAYRGKGDLSAAIGAYNTLLKAEPANAKARIGVAAATIAQGDRSAAREMLTAATAEGHGDREILFALGEMSFEDGNLDEAIAWYRRASEADGSWGKPLYKLGVSTAKKGDTQAAREFLTQALTVDPTSAEATLAKTTMDQMNR
jgi:Flp pilus assembly protein TadD